MKFNMMTNMKKVYKNQIIQIKDMFITLNASSFSARIVVYVGMPSCPTAFENVCKSIF